MERLLAVRHRPLLTPELLSILAEMGHGDEIAITDANFPSASCVKRLVQMPGAQAPRALQANTSLMPLDGLVENPAWTMQVVDAPDEIPPIVQEFTEILSGLPVTPARPVSLERFEFYARARSAYAIVRTGERRHYGNIILKKGVVEPMEGSL